MIKVRNLCFSYPGPNPVQALKNVSLDIKRGEKVALMGANGSGKTTLIRCLNGLYAPSSGSVHVDGFSTVAEEQVFQVRRRVGLVFQNPDNQIVATTVEREVAFGLENLGWEHNSMQTRVREALDRFGLSSRNQTPPHLLSGGERQRLALASIWVMQPRYLILDEPTSLLDPSGRRAVLDLLNSEMEGRTLGIILVTQIPEEALTCDRLLVMDRGNILHDGTPRYIFKNSTGLKKLGLRLPVEIELSRIWTA